MKHRSDSGFSITDIIMALSIISVAIVGIMLAQRNYIQSTSQVEVGLRALSLANSVMSTIRMHRFDENLNEPWDVTPGAEEGSADNYDDIDDYAGVSWDFSGDGFLGFTITSRVFNVDLNSSWLDSVDVRTSFKRIIVSVDHGVLNSPVVLSSVYAGIDGEE